jgi:hypothetical protein
MRQEMFSILAMWSHRACEIAALTDAPHSSDGLPKFPCSGILDMNGFLMLSVAKFKKVYGILTVIVALAIFLIVLACCEHSGDRGCVNQGNDSRNFAALTCCLQRHMSWNSEQEPHFVLICRPDRDNVGIAWPPYLVFNAPGKKGSWLMLRIGFRYDRNWRGYIFPAVACKRVAKPWRC